MTMGHSLNPRLNPAQVVRYHSLMLGERDRVDVPRTESILGEGFGDSVKIFREISSLYAHIFVMLRYYLSEVLLSRLNNRNWQFTVALVFVPLFLKLKLI